jgi:membrane protein implicated in regulation of membrane protease activity
MIMQPRRGPRDRGSGYLQVLEWAIQGLEYLRTMAGFAASVVAIVILVALVFLVGFLFFCLVRIATADEVRFLPKWAWAVAVVCVNPLGGAVYLLSQRLGRSRRPVPG